MPTVDEPQQSGFERVVRRVLWWIIVLFIFLAVVPYVGMMLFDAFKRGPFPWREMLPGCSLMFGPVLLWITLAVIYFRAPRELRSIYFGHLGGRFSGSYDPGGIFQFFSGYRKRFGMDIWFWLMLISIPWSVIVLVALVVLVGQAQHSPLAR